MDNREAYEAQHEAMQQTLGTVSQSTRERMFAGLQRYLATEVEHTRKAARKQPRKDERPDT